MRGKLFCLFLIGFGAAVRARKTHVTTPAPSCSVRVVQIKFNRHTHTHTHTPRGTQTSALMAVKPPSE